MAIRKIHEVGDPCLAKVCRPVTEFNDRLHELLDDMADTLEEAGGVGLAAPQVHVPLRLFVFRVSPERASGAEDDAPVDATVLINPTIEAVGEEAELGWEGCLSIPGMRGGVPRAARIRYAASIATATASCTHTARSTTRRTSSATSCWPWRPMAAR